MISGAGLCWQHVGGVGSTTTTTTFFLQLPGNKYHVNCAAFTPEPALRFRQDKINDVLEKTGEHDLSQHFACYREKGYATTVATFCSVAMLINTHFICRKFIAITGQFGTMSIW